MGPSVANAAWKAGFSRFAAGLSILTHESVNIMSEPGHKHLNNRKFQRTAIRELAVDGLTGPGRSPVQRGRGAAKARLSPQAACIWPTRAEKEQWSYRDFLCRGSGSERGSTNSVKDFRAGVGGADRDRTGDLVNAIHARSQLRYSPTGGTAIVASGPVPVNPSMRGLCAPVQPR